jgi:hypothetical protein
MLMDQVAICDNGSRASEYIREYVAPSVAVSLVDCRTQFVHVAAENIELDFFQIDFFRNDVCSANSP